MSRSKRKPQRLKAAFEAEEKERTRLSRELYDNIGQKLSAAKFNVAALQENAKHKNEAEKMSLEQALQLIDESINDVRSISYTMLPATLLKSGLIAAVKELIAKINHTHLQIEFQSVKFKKRLDRITESILFMIIQEGLNNIIIHSEATEANIQLVKHKKELTLLIEDNGNGFEINKLKKNSGKGLRNIEARIGFLNGEIQIDSYPGKGTTIAIELPLPD